MRTSKLSRRAWLLGTVSLAACAATGALTPAQVISDAEGIESGFVRIVPLIEQFAPKLLPATAPTGQISQAAVTNSAGTGWLDIAGQLLGDLATPPPVAAGAGTLATVEKYFNWFLDGVASITPALAMAVPGLGPVVGIIDAATILLPTIESFITSVPTVTASAVRGSPAAKRATARAPRVTALHVAAFPALAPLTGGVPRPMTVSDARVILGAPARP